jgi:hypothetical protein
VTFGENDHAVSTTGYDLLAVGIVVSAVAAVVKLLEKAWLGFPARPVLGAVFRRGLLVTGGGLAARLPVAYALARLLASLIYGVTATAPAAFIGIPLALIAPAGLPMSLPARRAMKIDPIVALRYE